MEGCFGGMCFIFFFYFGVSFRIVVGLDLGFVVFRRESKMGVLDRVKLLVGCREGFRFIVGWSFSFISNI